MTQRPATVICPCSSLAKPQVVLFSDPTKITVSAAVIGTLFNSGPDTRRRIHQSRVPLNDNTGTVNAAALSIKPSHQSPSQEINMTAILNNTLSVNHKVFYKQKELAAMPSLRNRKRWFYY